MRLCCFRGASATDHPLVRVKTRIHKYLILLINLAHPAGFEPAASAFGETTSPFVHCDSFISTAVQMAGYFHRDLVGCDNERSIKVDVSLRDAP